jgi:hypothetical protein
VSACRLDVAVGYASMGVGRGIAWGGLTQREFNCLFMKPSRVR